MSNRTRNALFAVLDALATKRGRTVAYVMATVIALSLNIAGAAFENSALLWSGCIFIAAYCFGLVVGYVSGVADERNWEQ